MKRFLVLFLLLVLPALAEAARWAEVTRDDNGSIYYVDLNSIQTQGQNVSYWQKQLLKNLKKIKIEDTYIKGQKVAYAMVKRVENCALTQTALLSLVYYGGQHQVLITDEVNPYLIEWISITPETIGETMHNFVCQLKDINGATRAAE